MIQKFLSLEYGPSSEQGNTLTSISKLLSTTEYSGYPIVKSLESMQALLLHLAPSTLDPKP